MKADNLFKNKMFGKKRENQENHLERLLSDFHNRIEELQSKIDLVTSGREGAESLSLDDLRITLLKMRQALELSGVKSPVPEKKLVWPEEPSELGKRAKTLPLLW